MRTLKLGLPSTMALNMGAAVALLALAAAVQPCDAQERYQTPDRGAGTRSTAPNTNDGNTSTTLTQTPRTPSSSSTRPLVDNQQDLLAQAPSFETLVKQSRGGMGYVDDIKMEGGNITLSGWSFDKEAMVPASVTYAFLGNRVIGAARPSIARAEITAGKLSSLIGFQITAPWDRKGRSSEEKLRFFSVAPNNKVFEVQVHEPVAPKLQEALSYNRR